MNIHIRANGMELTGAVEEYVRKKAEAVSKQVGDDSVADLYVEIGKTTDHHKGGEIFRAEFNLNTSHGNFRAEEEQADLYASIDLVKDELINIMRGDKSKRQTLWRRGAQRIKNLVRGNWR